MSEARGKAHQALKRLLVNGPLTGLPSRKTDLDMLLALAASRFEPHRIYRESEVNDLLRTWLETFCAPFGIDHVSLRRCMVDAQILKRDKSGSAYRIDRKKAGEAMVVDPAQVLAEIRSEREARKRRRINGG